MWFQIKITIKIVYTKIKIIVLLSVVCFRHPTVSQMTFGNNVVTITIDFFLVINMALGICRFWEQKAILKKCVECAEENSH